MKSNGLYWSIFLEVGRQGVLWRPLVSSGRHGNRNEDSMASQWDPTFHLGFRLSEGRSAATLGTCVGYKVRSDIALRPRIQG